MLGISGAEFFVILLVIAIVVGPQRLPEYTRKLTQGVRRLRVFLDDAKTQIAEEVGPELGELNLSDLDPRNYDPRKIVRDALGEDLDAIRKDLTNPFQSVMETAKEASDEAAAAVSGKGQKKSKSLSKMIEDKADETRAARAASTGAAAAVTAAAVTSDQQESDDSAPAGEKDPEQAAQEAAAVTAELPQVDLVAAGEELGGAEPAAEEVAAEDAGDATADAAQIALAAGDTVTAEIPEVQPAADAVEPAAEENTAAEPQASAEEAAAVIPSSLEEAGPQDDSAQALRPVSPRDIVRAANEAARTRAEAATAAVA